MIRTSLNIVIIYCTEEAYHPENGSTRLLHLLRTTPPRLHRGQAKVTYFNSPALVKKNIWQGSSGNVTIDSWYIYRVLMLLTSSNYLDIEGLKKP